MKVKLLNEKTINNNNDNNNNTIINEKRSNKNT